MIMDKPHTQGTAALMEWLDNIQTKQWTFHDHFNDNHKTLDDNLYTLEHIFGIICNHNVSDVIEIDDNNRVTASINSESLRL